MLLGKGFDKSFTKQGSWESHKLSAHTIAGFNASFHSDSENFKEVRDEKQHFFAGVMTRDQELSNPGVPKQLTDLGFVCVERFRNKHVGNILCYYRRLPETLREFKESEDGMSIVVTP